MKRILLVLAIFLVSLPALAREVEATLDDVKVYAAANRTAAVIASLAKGESLESKDRIGLYWEVVLKDGRSGFVNFSAVKQKKAHEGVNLSRALREVVQNHRNAEDPANIRSRSTVMGVRGLQDSKEMSSAGNVRPNLRMVFNLEAYTVSRKSLEEVRRGVSAEIAEKLKAKSPDPTKP